MHAPLIDYAAPLRSDTAAGALLVQRAFQCRELMSAAGVNSCPFLNTKLA